MTRPGNNVLMASKLKQDVNGEHSGDEVQTLADELTQLNDDFAEYGDISAFMCNAFANALKENEWLTVEVISGARICSNWLQQRNSELKAEIRYVHARYVEEQNEEAAISHVAVQAPSQSANPDNPADHHP